MRTSSQLTKVDQCARNPHIGIGQSLDYITRAAAQKDVCMRLLQGEPITDITAEIDSILTSKDCLWETHAQKAISLALYSARIHRFADWALTQNITFPNTTQNTIVNFFGEDIVAKPDFFMEDGEQVYICKLKTSRFRNEDHDILQNETYALGLAGEKLFPGRNIYVRYLHLGDKDNKTETAAILQSFDDPRYKKISEIFISDSLKEYFAAKHEQEKGQICSPEECAACSMYNVCHFEEPPISISVEKAVKPISEIRLTYAQQQIVDYETGVARINAGAGAGKTLVVAMRIVELLKKGYAPEDICLLTFTNAGAEEMTARVVQYCVGNGLTIDSSRLTSTTFNAFCQRLITEHYEELGFTVPPRVLPDEMQSGIINRLLDQFPQVPEWNYAVSARSGASQFMKTSLNSAKAIFAKIKKEGLTRTQNPWTSYMGQLQNREVYSEQSLDIIFQMYEMYNDNLHMRNFVEYDDQILLTFQLLEVHPSLFDEIGFRHIIVDEFQDTDLPQIKLLGALCDTTSFKSFMAVGDDSQSIFGFRHTSPEYMIHFGDYFGRYDDFNLLENHRSTGNIIEFANTVNAKAKCRVDKDLIATKPDGVQPFIQGFYSAQEEYNWIAGQIERLIENGKTPSDIAVLMSDRNELTAMASALTQRGVPSVLMNPVPYIGNSRVAALVTFFDSFMDGTTRGLMDYQNALLHGAFVQAAKEQIETFIDNFSQELNEGPHTLAKFLEYADVLDEEKTDDCYQAFLEKVRFCQSMQELIEFFADFKMYGAESRFKREGKYEGVCLTTVHSAKGLEWDTTYLSLSHFDKASYHNRFRCSDDTLDEIIRKWFVGSTRARENLYMTGQYAVKFTQKEQILNRYVQNAYELLGKTFDFEPARYWAVQQKEKVHSGISERRGIKKEETQEGCGKQFMLKEKGGDESSVKDDYEQMDLEFV